jgi:hypothetical protein
MTWFESGGTRATVDEQADRNGDRSKTLVTSPTPGHAMRALEAGSGAILGKALDSLETGMGSIRVLLVTR